MAPAPSTLWSGVFGGSVAPGQDKRNPLLPKLYIVPNHPQCPSPTGTAYVYCQDTTPASMNDFRQYVEAMPVPVGKEDTLKQDYGEWQTVKRQGCSNDMVTCLGLIQLLPGDCILARSTRGLQKAEDDIMQAWLTGR